MKIAVLGATGRTGRLLVEELSGRSQHFYSLQAPLVAQARP